MPPSSGPSLVLNLGWAKVRLIDSYIQYSTAVLTVNVIAAEAELFCSFVKVNNFVKCLVIQTRTIPDAD